LQLPFKVLKEVDAERFGAQLYKRSLTIWEKALGPDHIDVATGSASA
jgi:hypothetical protein